MTMAVAAGAFVGLLLAGALAFNRLVRHRNLVREAWSGIDVQLERRHDLVPNLVEAVRGHAAFERGVLEAVTRLRGDARASRALQDGENALTAQLRGLLAVAEQYPQLRAGESFLDLQRQLAEVEHQLQMARRYYNGTVRDYNTAVESFPSNLVARIFGFPLEELFQVESAVERAVPEVRP
ncbi:MAG: LemA family protein [Candidatus Binatia bacterium]